MDSSETFYCFTIFMLSEYSFMVKSWGMVVVGERMVVHETNVVFIPVPTPRILTILRFIYVICKYEIENWINTNNGLNGHNKAIKSF